MKVVTNTKLIEQRAKWAKRVAPLTMLFLIGGLIFNFLSVKQPQYTMPTLILLALGFFSAIISSNLVNTWVREPRADQTLTQLLKKFGNDYLLFNYTANIAHALVAPDGIYAIVVKNHDGQVTINGRKSSRKFTWRRIFKLLADEGLGAPVVEAERQAGRLNKQLSQHLPDEEMPEIKPLVLFSHKDVDLTVNEPAVPVMQSSQLKSYLREQSKNRTISVEQRKKLAEILDNE